MTVDVYVHCITLNFVFSYPDYPVYPAADGPFPRMVVNRDVIEMDGVIEMEPGNTLIICNRNLWVIVYLKVP